MIIPTGGWQFLFSSSGASLKKKYGKKRDFLISGRKGPKSSGDESQRKVEVKTKEFLFLKNKRGIFRSFNRQVKSLCRVPRVLKEISVMAWWGKKTISKLYL